MLHIDLRYLGVIPVALAETFLIWMLWNLFKQSKHTKRSTPNGRRR
jgi:hypothetical protein